MLTLASKSIIMSGATFSGGSLFMLLFIEGLETMLPVVNQ